MEANFLDALATQANSDALALHHSLEAWQYATSGMMIARCYQCSALVYIMPSGVVSGGAITLECTSDFPSALGERILAEYQRSIPRTPERVVPAFHASSDLSPDNAPCPYCGNRSTIHTRGCKHCGASSDLATKQRPKKLPLVAHPTDYVVPQSIVIMEDIRRVRYVSLSTTIGRYTAPCGVECNASAIWAPEDYYGIGTPRRLLQSYNCGHAAIECYHDITPGR